MEWRWLSNNSVWIYTTIVTHQVSDSNEELGTRWQLLGTLLCIKERNSWGNTNWRLKIWHDSGPLRKDSKGMGCHPDLQMYKAWGAEILDLCYWDPQICLGNWQVERKDLEFAFTVDNDSRCNVLWRHETLSNFVHVDVFHHCREQGIQDMLFFDDHELW